MRRSLFTMLMGITFVVPCFAQDPTRIQGKVVVRVPMPKDTGWYPAGWSITNIRQQAPDNTNLMIGVGRKLENGWIEFMAQRQYSIHSNQWFFDFRFQRKLADRFSAFIEVAPFLETKAVYNFVRVEGTLLGNLNAVFESENIYREGINSLGFGPGLGLKPLSIKDRVKFAPVIAWQIRPNEPDFIRVYCGFLF